MTIQPARHECNACCPLQAKKPGIQPVVGNTHGTHVEQVVSSFQKILRGSQLTWYIGLHTKKSKLFISFTLLSGHRSDNKIFILFIFRSEQILGLI